MDDIELKKAEIDKQLEREANNLAKLKSSLERSDQMTKGMLSILESFDTRIRKLEETITPVYQKTGNLQRRQENIEKALSCLDHVIGYYNTARETEPMIREGPSNNLEQYLKCMEKLHKAETYFKENNPGSPEYNTVLRLFNSGKDGMEREFKNIVSRYTKPVTPIVINSLVNVSEEDIPGGSQRQKTIEHIPEKAVEELFSLGKWINANNQSSTEFLSHYANVRGNNLVRSLEGFREHLKKTAGSNQNTFNVQGSPLLTAKMRGTSVKDTPTRRSTKRMAPVRRTASLLKSSIDSGTMKRQQSFNVGGIDDEPTKDLGVDNYLSGMTALLKLIQSENELLTRILPEKHQRKYFDLLIQPGLESVVSEGEQIAQFAKRSIIKHDFIGVVSVFPVIRHLRILKNEFDLTLEGCQAPTRNKIVSLLSTLDLTGAKGLEVFIDNIKNDPDKQSHMPRDGTVHELTSNVLLFLEQLLEYTETAGAMLVNQELSSSANASQLEQRYRMKLAEYVTKVLAALGLNLNNKADSYNDVTLQAIFMLNNYNYILKSLQKSGLIDLIVIHNPSIAQFYDDQITTQRKEYCNSWNRVLQHIVEDKPYNISDPHRLKDKDRQYIKDKFAGFNKDFDDLCRIQRAYAIPDKTLRSILIKDNKTNIITKYQIFWDKYIHLNFTKNPEKYVKFTVDDVNRQLDKFFDSSVV